MALIRPGARRALALWGETAAAAALAAAATAKGLHWLAGGVPAGWLLLAAAAATGLWLRSALAGARAARRAQRAGPGVLSLREGEIGYLSAEGGGFLDIDDLIRVEIVVSAGTAVWRLSAEHGHLLIPAGAAGAEALPDALARLAGFADWRAAELLAELPAGRHLIWARPGARLPPPGLHLIR